MPESEISVVTPNEFMVGMVSFSDIASAKSFPLFEQEGNKINITATKNADMIYVVDEGRIIESGDHHSLMKSGGKYSEMYTLQAKKYV